MGKRNSVDDLFCIDNPNYNNVATNNNNKPQPKPCPQNTSRVKYRRNPSDYYGDCVAEDIRCLESLDDGHCWKCRDGLVPGWNGDGLCYEIPDFWN